MNRADAIAWRNRVAPRIEGDIPARVAEVERAGMSTLIPTDTDWPHALNDLGLAPEPPAPRGDLLPRRRSTDRVTMTGSRAASEYGVQVAGHLAGDLAQQERTIVAGGGYGRDAADTRSALAGGGGTIAVLAGAALTVPTRAGTRTCWPGSAISGCWPARLLRGRRRPPGGGSWPAPVCWVRSRARR